MSQDNIVEIDDLLWERLIELTDGEAALCYQCGVCTAICPWGLVRQDHLSVRTLLRHAQLGLLVDDAHDPSQTQNLDLWLCTTCGQCQPYCPRGVNINQVMRGMRYIAWERRNVEPGLPSLLWSVHWNGNPWSQPPSQRMNWVGNLDIPVFDPKQHELLLYIGCTSSYDRRAQKIARALALVLQDAGVKFGYLGDDEPCCGEAALSVGHIPYFEELAQKAIKIFREKGVQELVTISPHCYDVFKNHYGLDLSQNEISPFHYTQLLARLVDDGRLEFPDLFSERITFQDPCYLGRHNSEYAAPRRVLQAVPGVEIVEMDEHMIDGLCCGGGGGRMWLESEVGERFADLRIQQALATGAGILATACPFCVACLEDSIKAQNINNLQVCDVAELAKLALGL